MTWPCGCCTAQTWRPNVYAVDPAWLTAHDAPGKQLTLLAELLILGRTLSNVSVSALSPAPETRLLSIQAGSVGAVESQLEPWTGLAQISQVQLRVDNSTGFAQSLPPFFRKSPVRLLLGIGAVSTTDTLLPVFYGHVDQVTATPTTCTIRLVPGAFSWHKDLTRLVSDYFIVGRTQQQLTIPLLVSRNNDVAALQVTSEVQSMLAQPLTTTDTVVWVQEFQAAFPASGTITIEAETLTYGRREIVGQSTGNALLLTDLTRTAPTTHAAGAPVELVLDTWQYLVGYACQVLAVRNNGLLVDPADYTVTTLPIAGSLPVTVLAFDAAFAPGQIRVDVDGSNITSFVQPISNGSFETGDLSSWTLTGATGTVTTGDTPDDSGQKLELTGALSPATGTLHQDIAVTPGQGYIMDLWAQRRQLTPSNAVVNGRFETGDLTGWTETLTISQPEITLSHHYLVTEPWQTFPYGVEILPTTPTDAADERWYEVRLQQEVTVVSGEVYTLEGSYQLGGLLRSPSRAPGASPAAYASSTSSLDVKVESLTPAAVVVDFHDSFPGLPQWTFTRQLTPTVTTLRVTIVLRATSLGLPLALTGLLSLGLTRNTQTTESELTVQVGTAADPDAYASVPLTWYYNEWFLLRLPFVSATPTARLTLAASYSRPGLPAPVWVDAIAVVAPGRNPVDIIRWVITTFLAPLGINEASFQAAYLARAQWLGGGQWRDPGDSRALLTRLADQFELRYFENGNGEACLVPIPLGVRLPATAPPTFTPQTTHSWEMEGEAPTHLATDFYLYYNPREGAGGTNPEDYGGMVSATPERTTGAQELQLLCFQAASAYGVRIPLRYFAEAIQDQATAHLKLRALVYRHTTFGLLATCTTPLLSHAPLEIGDTVLMQHGLLGDVPLFGEVLGVTLDLGEPAVQLTARLTGVLGTEEGYELPEEIMTGGTEEGYEV